VREACGHGEAESESWLAAHQIGGFCNPLISPWCHRAPESDSLKGGESLAVLRRYHTGENSRSAWAWELRQPQRGGSAVIGQCQGII